RNNIFGVDIDPQAVEITMMSLYLKALEGERGMLPKKQHLLPPLSNNIKCGNSLIGYDILDAPLLSLRAEGEAISDETKSRINPFDWDSKSVGFGDIMANGGFDVIIGNPPYVRQEMIGEFKDYFQKHYEVYQGTADLYTYFIEKGVSLLKTNGLFSYIVANKWMRANYGEPLRRWMKKQRIEEITDFGDLPVFETATTYPCIVRIKKGVIPAKAGIQSFSATHVKTLAFNNLTDYVSENSFAIEKSSLDDKGWSLVNKQSQNLLNKLRKAGSPLGEYVKGKIFYGIKTGLNEAFVIDEETKNRLIKEISKSKEMIKPFLLGRDVKRYESPQSERYLILIPKGWTRSQMSHSRESGNPRNTGFRVKHGMTESGAWKWFSENYPSIAAHLESHTEKARKRYDKGEYWWELRTCDYYEEFEKPKIIVPAIVKSASYAFDREGFYSNDKTT
ncbi:MAG: Eco57I restriction-modification methylase domain-containing protein, partial [Nitrospirae bacterium]|nr:Eco57I restriction-modification methylase domain-containing protein [Nitrospirota bacterium]